MTKYNSYTEAKIANPKDDIYFYEDDNGKTVFTNNKLIPLSYLARASDYCMSVKDFLGKGHKFVDGDVYLCADGSVHFIGTTIDAERVNIKGNIDYKLFVLSAKVFEEKEELRAEDVPEGTTHYCDGTFVMMNDSSNDYGWCKVWFEGKWHKNAPIANCVRIEELVKKDSTKEPTHVEWNDEGLPPVGCHCLFKKIYEIDKDFSPCYIIGYRESELNKGDMWIVFSNEYDHLFQDRVTRGAFEFRPIETPEQKQERELLESAYDLYKVYMEENDPNNLMTFKQFKNNIHLESYKGFLNIVNKFSFNRKDGDTVKGDDSWIS